MNTEKHNAVAKGIKRGIYTDCETTKRQIYGFAGATFKSFMDLGEAEKSLHRQTGNNGNGGTIIDLYTGIIDELGAWAAVIRCAGKVRRIQAAFKKNDNGKGFFAGLFNGRSVLAGKKIDHFVYK